MACAGAQFLQEIDDITECKICAEMYNNPKILPCVHTFCLKCLEQYAKDKEPGEVAACPLCRQEFTIPQNGISTLPGNFFIDQLVGIRKLSNPSDHHDLMCEICSDEGEMDPAKTAMNHCVNCQQNLCQNCGKNHTKQRMSRSHQVIEIGKEQNESLLKSRSSFCDQHTDEQIKLYCSDCQMVICMMCFAVGHKSHMTDDINKISEEFRQNLESEIQAVKERLGECLEEIEGSEKCKRRFLENVKYNEDKITAQNAVLTNLILKDTSDLLKEFNLNNASQMKEIETGAEELSGQLVMLESFIRYAQEVKCKAPPSEVCRLANNLFARSKSLQEMTFYAVELEQRQKFSALNLVDALIEDHFNIVGSLHGLQDGEEAAKLVKRSEFTELQRRLIEAEERLLEAQKTEKQLTAQLNASQNIAANKEKAFQKEIQQLKKESATAKLKKIELETQMERQRGEIHQASEKEKRQERKIKRLQKRLEELEDSD